MTSLLLLCLPWIAWGAWFAFVVRKPPRLPGARASGAGAEDAAEAGVGAIGAQSPTRRGRELAGNDAPRPSVSVIVPARDEARNIGRCVASIAASRYPDFEVVVVDDRSTDGTADAARGVDGGRARRVEVVEGEPLPDGWFGKQWACWQGWQRARGDLLLFTDADTVHGPDLLARAVSELELRAADALTVAGVQLMKTFWEKLVQPQVFALMALRYPRMGRPRPAARWRGAIANGQYILLRREAYEALGGHEAVRWQAAEDLHLAQRLVRSGRRLVVRTAEDALATRMYAGLGELVAGWSKNVMQAGLQTLPPRLRPAAPALMLASAFALWLLPPLLLATGLVVPGWGGPTLLAWAGLVTGFNVAFWTAMALAFRAPWWAGPLYPLGSAVAHWILLRSWLGRSRVVWKGRRYAWDVYGDTPDAGAPDA